ncbi:hypothetical protein RRG08_054906 [Elysia crispata]|uniref:Uncharacterized protein n=1 Tax=Elysia crispata TaxID=231223 RepID=A0AAE1A5X4_9GAST|nr:hypothetical protein RRG08_054906 [Elysia crispata]
MLAVPVDPRQRKVIGLGLVIGAQHRTEPTVLFPCRHQSISGPGIQPGNYRSKQTQASKERSLLRLQSPLFVRACFRKSLFTVSSMRVTLNCRVPSLPSQCLHSARPEHKDFLLVRFALTTPCHSRVSAAARLTRLGELGNECFAHHDRSRGRPDQKPFDWLVDFWSRKRIELVEEKIKRRKRKKGERFVRHLLPGGLCGLLVGDLVLYSVDFINSTLSLFLFSTRCVFKVGITAP